MIIFLTIAVMHSPIHVPGQMNSSGSCGIQCTCHCLRCTVLKKCN